MKETTKNQLKQLVLTGNSFATIIDKRVYIWLNVGFKEEIDRAKILRLAKALTITKKLTGLDTVVLYYHPEGEVAFTRHGLSKNKYKSKVFINMWYGKTIKGLTYTCIHEACHVVTPKSEHGPGWVREMQKYYPADVIVAGIARNIPWPNGVSKAPKIRPIVVLNDHLEDKEI